MTALACGEVEELIHGVPAPAAVPSGVSVEEVHDSERVDKAFVRPKRFLNAYKTTTMVPPSQNLNLDITAISGICG